MTGQKGSILLDGCNGKRALSQHCLLLRPLLALKFLTACFLSYHNLPRWLPLFIFPLPSFSEFALVI